MEAFITDADRGGGSIRATLLASQCRDDAILLGIAIDDEPERGSVESIIYARMQMPKREQIKFWKVWRVMSNKFSRKH
jgi:hypothetical protein